MQNIDSNEKNDTLNKFENLQLTKPSSLESLICEKPKLVKEGSVKTESSRAIQSDPEETQAKVKTRSRFTIALRKLSRSTRKKEKQHLKPYSSIATESSEQIVSSGTEDLHEANAISTDEDKKLKKKKKSSKSLFGLKKSKIVPKPDDTKIELSEQDKQTEELLKPIFQDNENEVVITTERLTPLSSRSKVQITIKSKKIETVASQEQQNQTPLTSSPSPLTIPGSNVKETLESDKPSKDVNIPKSTTTTAATAITSSNELLDKSNKLKTKVKTQTAQKPITATTTAQSKSKQLQQEQEESEKITITQCSKDTPPKERAPTKPSRLTTTTSVSTPSTTTTTTSQTSKSSGAVRKTAATTRAAIRLVTGAKSKQKTTSSVKTSKGSNVNTTNTATTATTASLATSKKESVLMINPQRGYRLPRPTSITSSSSTTTTNSVKEPQLATTEAPINLTTTPPLPTSSSNQNQTTSPSTPPPPTASPDNQITNHILPQSLLSSSSEIQSSLANASLVTSTSTSTPLPLPLTPIITATTVTDNSQQQQQENIQSPQIDNSNSVHLTAFLQTDDHISLAESVKPDTLYDSVETIKESSSPVKFAVGSPVSAPVQQLKGLFTHNITSLYIDGKDSSLSEANRRRIQYVSQPTLFDECNSTDNKRVHYRYQSGVSDLSLDTDENEDNTLADLKQMPAFGDLTMDQDMEPSVMTSSNTEKREHLYKILVIGELGTGKTSFIKRYVHQFFSQNYRATIGVDFALKVLHWDPNTIVRLQLWDIAGQERFGNMTRVYYKEAVGAFIVFDVTRSGTFDCVSKWKEDLDSKVQLPDGSPIPCILLANKCDQDKQGVVTNAEKMDEYVKEHNFAGWFETSAKENINIDEAARALVNKILLNDKLISASDLADSEKFNLNNTADQTAMDGKNKCSC